MTRPLFICFLMLWMIIDFSDGTYHPCGSTLGSLVSLEVSNCKEEDARCILIRNTTATIKLTFTLKEDVNKIKAVVHGVVMSVPIEFPLPNPDACVNSGLSCPLKANETYTYTAELPVASTYPKITVDVKWELQKESDLEAQSANKPEGDTSNDLVCVIIPSKLQ